MSEDKEPLFTEKDVEQMARSFGRPPPESLTKKVMAKVDAIDREAAARTQEALARTRTPRSRDDRSHEGRSRE